MSDQTLGAGPKRIDGRLKVTGQATYTADHQLDNKAHAYGVFSTISRGRITGLALEVARNMPGVIEIFHHGNFPALHHTPSSMAGGNKVEETRLPFEDERIYYDGQFVALVVAERFDQARAAAQAVTVRYEEETPRANLEQGLTAHGTREGKGNHSRGNAKQAFESGTHRMEATYTTPVETHNPMEMHATLAHWPNGRLQVFESSQGVVQQKGAMAKIFNLAPHKVEVISTFIGSGFGSKLWMWPHAVAAAAASREIGRPVELVVPRSQMFTTTGHRPETKQTLKLATDEQGRLVALSHHSISTTSCTDQYVETCGSVTKSLYSCDNVSVDHRTTQVNRGTPTSMRAPGAAPGLFALESAVDEMALAAGIDPLTFRLDQFADRDESQDLPFSSNHIRETAERAAERFGWHQRNPKIKSMREGREIIGYGMAACNWEALKRPCDAHVALRADGTVYASCATQDIGTGTYTIVAQTLVELTGVPFERIEVELGDTSYPKGPISGGSWTTATTLPAIAEATRHAIMELKTRAVRSGGPFDGVDVASLNFENGVLSHNGKQMSFAEVLSSMKLANAEGDAHTEGADTSKYSYRSFGTHFVEVRWDPLLANLRVARVVSAIDVGRVMNEKTARNQVEGAIVMGLGMAMFEHTEYDPRTARVVNNNYAEYLVPVHADQPEIDVILLDYPDTTFNEFGARGIGEIGITGLAAAVANAVYHATGIRVRDLPITKERLMAGA
ncbi:xanthine dehydrogenase family protein molybdopterin-binding subunit [Larsenimonas rhizosphaerae]|uniref:Xanthine dehydrogenase family protein molybdopterin-binding subunit n=1 Tax=Larsenimonas rhizosphaerae TaxID=2944682 RepID=A0AA42CXU2_9GAMM|nr:xanthine dehydrogenase family protein molybdopterin-binding subunit [Larsenimonas rhizosphaerae]MCX2524270.1 xanthine dehydrogenase family protein molybdopterin-binding subunit [Larsenimonas rhizosphaerae]